MRRSVAFAAVLALAGFAAPAMAQSRYGPPPASAPQADEVQAAQTALDMAPQSLLAWRGKTVIEAPAPAQPQAAVPVRPEPAAPWAQRLASLTPARERALPEPAGMAPSPAPLPTNLYDAPPAPSRPVLAPAPAPAPAPATQTALLGGPPSQPNPAPANPAANPGPRFYSVYREYGVRPDAIPTAPQGSRGQETTLRELPSTPSLAAPDDTQYLPARPANSDAASRRTF